MPHEWFNGQLVDTTWQGFAGPKKIYDVHNLPSMEEVETCLLCAEQRRQNRTLTELGWRTYHALHEPE